VSLVSSKALQVQLSERSSASCEPNGQAFAVAAMPIANTAASATLSRAGLLKIFGTLIRVLGSWGFVGTLLFSRFGVDLLPTQGPLLRPL